jgi:hypothetical protein
MANRKEYNSIVATIITRLGELPHQEAPGLLAPLWRSNSQPEA